MSVRELVARELPRAAVVREGGGAQRAEDDVGEIVGAIAQAALAQQHPDVGAVEGVRAAREVAPRRSPRRPSAARRGGRGSPGRRCPKAIRRSSGGAPGPSGGSPRIIASCSSISCSEMTARARLARSPKRRKSVPLPTPASAATASIVTFAGPQRANSSSAAASTLRRFSAASARSGRASPKRGRELGIVELM